MFPARVQRGIELAIEGHRKGYLDPTRLQAVLTFYDRDGAVDPPEPELVLQRVGGLTTGQLTDLLGVSAEPVEGTPFTDRLSLLEPIGEGAMGAVYRAHDRVLKRTVAVKVIKPDRLDAANADRLLARFQREAEAMARVRHPACVPIFDAGVEKAHGRPYIVMGLVAGKSLRQLIAEQDGPLDWRRVVTWGRDLALGLQACHDVGVVHRDVKPANVLVDAGDRPFLTDFGVALDDQARTKLTAEQAAVGTLAYMAPEQAVGHPVDARVDVYALGATLYEAATGRAPFEATHALLLIRQIVEADPEPLRRLAPAAPADLDAVLQQALAKSRDDRYATAQALALDLGRVLAGEPVLARRTAQDQLARWVARRRRPLGLALLAAVGVSVVAGVTTRARARRLRAEVLGAIEAAATTSDLDAAARQLARHQLVDDAELGRAVRAAQDDLGARRALALGAAHVRTAAQAQARVHEVREELHELRKSLEEAPLSLTSAQLQRTRDLNVALREANRASSSALDAAQAEAARLLGAAHEADRRALLAEALGLRLAQEEDPTALARLKAELRSLEPKHPAVAPVVVTIGVTPVAECRVLRLEYDPASGCMLERPAAAGPSPLTVALAPDDYVVVMQADGRLPARRCLRVEPRGARELEIALVESASLGALAGLDLVFAPGGVCRRGYQLRPAESVDDLLVPRNETDVDLWRSFALATTDSAAPWPDEARRIPAGMVTYGEAVGFAVWWSWLLKEASSPWRARLPRLPEMHWLLRGEFAWVYPWGPLLETTFFANSSTVPRGLPGVDAFPRDRSWAGVHALAGSCFEWVESRPERHEFKVFGASKVTMPEQAGSQLAGWSEVAEDLAYDTNTVRLVFEPCPLPDVVTDLAAAQRHSQAARRLETQDKQLEAQQAWGQAIAASPLDPDLWAARAVCKNIRGDLWGAWWDLSRALALGPTDEAVLRFNRAFVQRQRGLPAEAAADVTRALELKPGWPDGLALLGRIRAALGELDAARAALREALRLDPASEGRVREWLAEVDAAEQAQPR